MDTELNPLPIKSIKEIGQYYLHNTFKRSKNLALCLNDCVFLHELLERKITLKYENPKEYEND